MQQGGLNSRHVFRFEDQRLSCQRSSVWSSGQPCSSCERVRVCARVNVHACICVSMYMCERVHVCERVRMCASRTVSVTPLSLSLSLGVVSQSYGSEGLKLAAHEEAVSFGQSVLKLTLDPGSPEHGLLTAECRLDHPFFVKNKGNKNRIKANKRTNKQTP